MSVFWKSDYNSTITKNDKRDNSTNINFLKANSTSGRELLQQNGLYLLPVHQNGIQNHNRQNINE